MPDPVPGERFSSVAGRIGVGRVVTVTFGEQLTARILGALMSYVLVPHGDATRLLLLKVELERRSWWSAPLAVGDWPMARRQLLDLRARAESADASS